MSVVRGLNGMVVGSIICDMRCSVVVAKQQLVKYSQFIGISMLLCVGLITQC